MKWWNWWGKKQRRILDMTDNNGISEIESKLESMLLMNEVDSLVPDIRTKIVERVIIDHFIENTYYDSFKIVLNFRCFKIRWYNDIFLISLESSVDGDKFIKVSNET